MSTKFDYLLGIDFETTGVCVRHHNPLYNKNTNERHQIVSGGLIVIDAATYKPIEKLYLEVKWNDESIRQRDEDSAFGTYAEKIHGLTKKHLDEHGVTEEVAIEQIANLVMAYWGNRSPLNCLGHNVNFDIRCLRDLFERHEMKLTFSHRHIDSFGIGHSMWNTYDSNELFDLLTTTKRNDHNALEDIELTLESIATTRSLFQDFLHEKNIKTL